MLACVLCVAMFGAVVGLCLFLVAVVVLCVACVVCCCVYRVPFGCNLCWCALFVFVLVCVCFTVAV